MNHIILIGPLATGKSTVATKLSELTGMHNHPVDKLKWYYRHKNGYDLNQSTHTLKNFGFEALIKYAKTFFGSAELQQLFNEFEGVVDLGATDTVCFDLLEQQEIIKVMAPYPNVFFILPSEDLEESEHILTQRLYQRYANDKLKFPVIDSYLKMNHTFIQSETNRLIAKHIIYTKDKSVEAIATEILQKSVFNNERKDTYLQRVS